jgi:biopolymer transport protein ExbD
MSPVVRKKKQATPMSITSLIDILTILLLFVMVNVQSDPDKIPEGMELENALYNEEIPKDSKIISLNVSYTGGDDGLIYYQNENSADIQVIANFSEFKTADDITWYKKVKSLDYILHENLGNNIGDLPVIIKIKADKNTPYKYIGITKRLLVEVWNDEKSDVRTQSKSDEFKLFFVTLLVEDEASDYYRLLTASRLGGF